VHTQLAAHTSVIDIGDL